MRRTALRSDDPILQRLLKLHPKHIDLELDRIERLLGRLGNPERALPPVVHVAGTNGKGSVIAFLRAFLEAAGYRVHVYTSPHLVRFNERIRLAGTLIDDDALQEVLRACETTNGPMPITFFEVTTAAAFLAFSRTPADVLLLETGLGGRLDATNVVEKPLLTVLSPIALDHQAFLGDTLEQVAAEKAGILKPRVPCVSAGLDRKCRSVVTSRAEELDVPLVEEGKDFFVTKLPEGFAFHVGHWQQKLPAPALAGPHQVRNAGLALACLERMPGFEVPEAARQLGLRTVSWPGRLQRLEAGPLAARLPEGWELWLDGGHNPAAAKALANQARQWRRMPLDLVVGLMKPRAALDYLKPLTGRVRRLQTVAIPGEENSHDPEAVAAAARQMSMEAAAAPDVATAVDRLVSAGAAPGRLLVCGSLYLAGSVLADGAPATLPA